MAYTEINKWAEALLDTGKKNNLINYRDLKWSTLEILAPDFLTLFNRSEHSTTFEAYDPKLADELEELSNGNEDDKIKFNREEYLATYAKKMKKQRQILIFNPFVNPIQVLRNIKKKARTAIEERGINIAYMAFGFIEWTDGENSKNKMKAPILLLPIDIINQSLIEPHFIKIMDSEFILNPTFAYKLLADYGITLPEYDEDLGIKKYLSKIEDICKKLGWSVLSECKIGIFSFQKLNMYHDLKTNAAIISKNKNVKALLGDLDEESDSKQEELEKFDYMGLHNVVDADSSQSDAIKMVTLGKSFVLQGPPGTGKSQTITNIIAECIANNKKVLFVSEKLAALNVVYDKLKKAGLEEFCLELHSHKANKKQVIEELVKTLKSEKTAVSDRAKVELDLMKKAQNDLNNYSNELHSVRKTINASLYSMYEELSAARDAVEVQYIFKDIKAKGEKYLNDVLEKLEQYIGYTSSIGYDYKENPWYGYSNLDTSYSALIIIESDLTDILKLAKDLSTISLLSDSKYEIKIQSINEAKILYRFFRLVKKSPFITPVLLNSKTATFAKKSAVKMKDLAMQILTAKSSLEQDFDIEVLDLVADNIYTKLTRQFSSSFARLFNKEYKAIVTTVQNYSKKGKKLKYKKLISFFETLLTYQKSLDEYNKLEKPLIKAFGNGYKGINTDFEHLIEDIIELDDICQTGICFQKLAKLNNEEFEKQKRDFVAISDRFSHAFDASATAEKRLNASFNEKEFDINNSSLQTLIKKSTACIKDMSKLDSWIRFSELLDKLKELDAFNFVNLCIEKNVPVKGIIPAFKKNFYKQWIDLVIHETETISILSRIPHDEAVKLFINKDRLNFDINKAKIRAVISSQKPNLDLVAPGSPSSILLREGRKKRKQKGVRQLLSELGEFIHILKPCFLMSPLSVSTLLNSDSLFDVVIFDEASQIFPQDAIGSIYRGKQLIVVGDSMQMPPSNFFNSNVEIEEEEEDNLTDFESILDICSTAFAQYSLKWHYRSRHEALISFSNKNFYDNKLITFPSSKKIMQGIGVDYYYVDGTFDRKSKTNKVEAEKIVDLIYEHFEKYPERSLGVVAFSISQQNLIDRLLSKRRQNNPNKEAFFNSDKPEPFFIKNLETVQGDERDTILFSIAYAKDSQGKLLMNFGPINRQGGERRLNVAVTRAKENVKIVSSMHYTDIDLSRSKSTGTRLLKEYLDYAENGTIALKRSNKANSFEKSGSDFEKEVCEFLRDNGFEVDEKVGSSSYTIDIAVKHPKTSDYVLAIECDGLSYHSTKSARDRDRLRKEVLERMGWSFYRMWSTDWFRSKGAEKELLLKATRKAIENSVKKKTSKQETEPKPTFHKVEIQSSFSFPYYEFASINELAKKHSNIQKIVYELLKVEAPVNEKWLLKRMVHLFNREKVTSVVTKAYNTAMIGYEKYGIIRRNGFLYLRDKEIPMLRISRKSDPISRSTTEIAVEEYANGLKELLRQNIKAKKEGLFKLVIQQMGLTRLNDTLSEQLELALAYISKDIKIDKNDNMSLK